MDFACEIKNRIVIESCSGVISSRGSYYVVQLIESLIKSFGPNPIKWPLFQGQHLKSELILINEFISRYQGNYQLSYEHLEICHCRNVTTETVVQSIKMGCSTVKQVSAATKAGTGCGTCCPQIQGLLRQLTQS